MTYIFKIFVYILFLKCKTEKYLIIKKINHTNFPVNNTKTPVHTGTLPNFIHTPMYTDC